MPSTPKPILIYGASGVTGKLCVDAAEAQGRAYLIGGRNRTKLESVAGPRCLGIRVADASNVGTAFDGVGCVVSTVGPFARYGLPVLDAAIAAGAHYVDTTAEQAFLPMALSRHDQAIAAGVTALPACGVEYAPMFLAASLLGPGPVQTYLWLDDFLPTQGSIRSMVAMAGIGPTPRPTRVQFQERTGWAIRIPGAEEVMVHPDCRTHLVLNLHEALPFSVMWPFSRWLPLDRIGDRIASWVTDPTAEQQRAAGYSVFVRQGSRVLRIDGRDVYGSTAQFAVTLAGLLAAGKATAHGVLPVGDALSAKATLEALGLEAKVVPSST